MAGGKLKGLVKKGVSKLKKELKPSSLKKRAIGAARDAVKDKIKDRSDAQSDKHGGRGTRVGIGRRLQPTVSASKTLEIKGDRKKRKANKKISQWEKQKKARAAVGSQQAAFLALDRSIKNKNKK